MAIDGYMASDNDSGDDVPTIETSTTVRISSSQNDTTDANADNDENPAAPKATIVNEEDLEAEYRDKILEDAAVAEIVKSKRTCSKFDVVVIALVVIIIIVVGAILGTRSQPATLITSAPTFSPAPSLAPSTAPSSGPTEVQTRCAACSELAGVPVDVNRLDLKRAILDYLRDPDSSPYGSTINCWDVSGVTDMSYAFNYIAQDEPGHDPELDDPIVQTFNEPLDCWDTSGVTSLSAMFWSASAFNGNIGTWNTTSVTTMSIMFARASSFNQDISTWDVSRVMDFSYMFAFAEAFNHDINAWDVSHATNMNYMLNAAESFDQDLSSWDVSNVTSMQNMFALLPLFNQDIREWNVSKVTNMISMFQFAVSFNQSRCEWGDSVDMMSTDFTDIFVGTSCGDQASPTNTSSSWCNEC